MGTVAKSMVNLYLIELLKMSLWSSIKEYKGWVLGASVVGIAGLIYW